jgi:hypothetical protein
VSTVSQTVEDMEVPANERVRDSRATAQAGTDREAENAVTAGVELVPSLQACRAAKRNGKPCRSTILLADGFCWVHSSSSPATPAERGRKGGLASGEVRREQGKSVRDRLREKVEEPFELVWSAFEAGLLSEDERARVAAAVAALDQAYGRPPVSIEGGDQPVAIVLGSLLQRAREEAE